MSNEDFDRFLAAARAELDWIERGVARPARPRVAWTASQLEFLMREPDDAVVAARLGCSAVAVKTARWKHKQGGYAARLAASGV